MHGFYEKNGVLHADGVALPDLAAEFGTPAYIYAQSVIEKQHDALQGAMAQSLPENRPAKLFYAAKANSSQAILRLLNRLGCGLEIVSEGELYRGLRAGFKGRDMISTSYGKTRPEIRACLEADIYQFNIEAENELPVINDIAKDMGKTASVLFRLNPDIKGGGHTKISTGRKRDKFGLSADKIIALYNDQARYQNLHMAGISMHIGSQVFTVESFKPAFEIMASCVKTLRDHGHNVERLDIGGGFPVQYQDEKLLDLGAYASWVADHIAPLETEIQLEPGRYLIANSGALLTEAIYVKKTQDKEFLVLDAAMNDLIRPTLYEAYHGIEPVANRDRTRRDYHVVGPICESGDQFAENRSIASIEDGDLLVIRDAGAYGSSMASNYNSRPLLPEILVKDGKAELIRKRQTFDDMIKDEMSG